MCGFPPGPPGTCYYTSLRLQEEEEEIVVLKKETTLFRTLPGGDILISTVVNYKYRRPNTLKGTKSLLKKRKLIK